MIPINYAGGLVWLSGTMTSKAFRIASLLAAASLPLAACQMTGAEPVQASASAPSASPPAFVEAACGGCHAVEPPFLSPNPQAPSFEAIANREGISEKSLAGWLADAHNYPEVMDFDMTLEQAKGIADYMITLRREDYEPES